MREPSRRRAVRRTMTRGPQERTARALARFPVHRVVRGGARTGAAPYVSPCSTT